MEKRLKLDDYRNEQLKTYIDILEILNELELVSAVIETDLKKARLLIEQKDRLYLKIKALDYEIMLHENG